MLITLLPQNRIGNYSAPTPINFRAGCARARSSFSEPTPNYSATPWHSHMQIDKKTFVTAMGKISVRLVFHGFIRSVPEVTSTVMTMRMMAMMALMMMPVRAMLMMAMTLRPRPLGPPGTARRAKSPW